MIDYYRSNIVTKFLEFLSPSLSQILAARLILYKMANSSATAAAGAVKRNQVKQNHNANVLGELKTTYSLGPVFFRSYEEALKLLKI